jgi:hypothetical protein
MLVQGLNGLDQNLLVAKKALVTRKRHRRISDLMGLKVNFFRATSSRQLQREPIEFAKKAEEEIIIAIWWDKSSRISLYKE